MKRIKKKDLSSLRMKVLQIELSDKMYSYILAFN